MQRDDSVAFFVVLIISVVYMCVFVCVSYSLCVRSRLAIESTPKCVLSTRENYYFGVSLCKEGRGVQGVKSYAFGRAGLRSFLCGNAPSAGHQRRHKLQKYGSKTCVEGPYGTWE